MDGYLIKPLDREKLTEALADLAGLEASRGLTPRHTPAMTASQVCWMGVILILEHRPDLQLACGREGIDAERRIGAIDAAPDPDVAAGRMSRATAQAAITWFKPLPVTLGRLGPLEVRLAQEKRDVKRAQKLRYSVFYQDGTAIADAATMLARRDKDAFDRICDHLLVIDHAAKPSMRGRQPVVGTYRLLRQDVAESNGGFYTENEFDIASLIDRHAGLRFLELGRSCVLPRYRNKRTVELLWHGDVELCPAEPVRRDDRLRQSFEGTDPDRLALPLSFLHHFAQRPGSLARDRAPSPPSRDEPDGEGGHRSEGSASRAAAA